MQKRFFVNSIIVAAGIAASVGLVSCVSATKGDRGVANLEVVSADEKEAAFQQIASQGVPKQQLAKAKGKPIEFADKPFQVKTLDEEYLRKLSNNGEVQVSQALIITDNDLALRKKIDVIRNAKETLKLVYFIWADDYTSSALMNELVKAANGENKSKSKVKVDIIVDLITNYKNLDVFKTLSAQTEGRIKTHFYNFPSQQMVHDANYMTLPCPDGVAKCHDFKKEIMKNLPEGKLTPFGKLFLTGIYGRSAAAMKAAVGIGAQIDKSDLAAFKGRNSDSGPEDSEAMIELAKVTLEAMQGDFLAKIKLSIAMSMYGEKIEPILQVLRDRFPIGVQNGTDESAKMWDHFSDYVHHKLVLADNTELVMGGRNIEDSYHVDERIKGAKNKYLFEDTDLWLKADTKSDANGFTSILKRYDDMRDSTMVKSLQFVEEHLDYEFIANTGKTKTDTGSAQAAMFTCVEAAKVGKVPVDKLGECILTGVRNPQLGYVGFETRKTALLQKLKDHLTEFNKHPYKQSSNELRHMSKDDLKNAKFFYLENLNVERNNNKKRITGSVVGSEEKNNKNIHAAWYRGLEGACVDSRQQVGGKYVYSRENPLRVIFNTAYLIMPSGLVHKIAQMMNRDFGNCSRVKITFITNSPFTSDLAPINLLAKYQIGVIFDHYKRLEKIKKDFDDANARTSNSAPVRDAEGVLQSNAEFKYDAFWPTLEYYEFAPAHLNDFMSFVQEGKKPDSLHTKTTLIGRDLIVGSANADFRSYFMDTNNAMLIRDAHKMNAAYIKYIDDLKRDRKIVDKMADNIGKTASKLAEENAEALTLFAKKYKQEEKMEKYGHHILKLMNDAGKKVHNTTSALMVYRDNFDNAQNNSLEGNDSARWPRTKGLNDAANSMDDLFKVF